MASVLLGCKIEEEVRRVREIICVFVHVYRRMRFAMDYVDDEKQKEEEVKKEGSERKTQGFQTAICSLLEKQPTLDQEERKNLLRYVKPLPIHGPIYKELEEELTNHEHHLLRELGFSLYWIPESHPHNFLLYFMRVLDLVQVKDEEEEGEKEKANDIPSKGENTIAQIAWNYCNDSCRLDLCVRYKAEMIVSKVLTFFYRF